MLLLPALLACSRTPAIARSGSGGRSALGAEWALSSHWAIKAEYLYADFGGRITANGTIINPGTTYAGRSNPIATSANVTAQVARVGVDYKF
jgi:outer membrane immunogenic protein